MADITVGTVQPLEGAQLVVKIAGETLIDGDEVHLKASDQRMWKADNDTSLETSKVKGMVVYGGATAGNPVCLQVGGHCDLGVTLAEGPYMLSSNAGKKCPFSDLGVGDFQSQTGFAESPSLYRVLPIAYGVALT